MRRRALNKEEDGSRGFMMHGHHQSFFEQIAIKTMCDILYFCENDAKAMKVSLFQASIHRHLFLNFR